MGHIPKTAVVFLAIACGDKAETFPKSSTPIGVGTQPDEDSDTPADTDTSATDDSGASDTASEDPTDTSDDSADPVDTGDTGHNNASSTGSAFYPGSEIHSPLTPEMLSALSDIASINPSLQDNVFMKVGASSTVSSSTLYCFAEDNVDLASHTHLQPSLSHFLNGDAAGSTPFDRDTEAARSGMSAGWAISGDPSPVASEFDTIQPRFALIHYGTNDMGLGSTHLSAMPGYYENMQALLYQLMSEGVIPILTGISHRGDRETADLWVPIYNALIRGMAQQWQIPFIDLYMAMDPLAGHGLSGDGVHLNGYSGGACQLTEEGLAYGYPMRNLIVLESLDRLRRGLLLGEDITDTAQTVQGEGSEDVPFTIHTLPFAHSADTTTSPHRDQDVYTDCDSDSDESGPEYRYHFETDETVALRAVVMDEEGADIDLHLFSESGCISRGHRSIEATLEPGSYTFILDTWVNADGEEQAGEYLLAIATCAPGDCE